MDELVERLRSGVEAWAVDNMSQNDFIDDIGISRNIFFELMRNPAYYDKMLPQTKRKINESLVFFGF